MSPGREIASSVPIEVNARSQIRERMAAGRIPWAGPLLLVSARSVLLLASQGLMALILFALHRLVYHPNR